MNIGIDAGALRGPLAGVGRYLWELLERLPALAPQDTFHLYASRPVPRQPSSPACRLHVGLAGRLLPGTFWLKSRARQFARRDRLDCFWGPAHFLPPTLPPGLRTVLTVHDLVWVYYPETMAHHNASVHRSYFRRSVERADIVIADSHSTRSDLLRELAVPEDKVRVVHAGVADAFRPMPGPEQQARLKALRTPGTFLLSVGTLEPRKNYPLLFRALAGVPDAQLIVVGRRGWKHSDITRTISDLALGARVHLLEYVSTEDLIALYSAAQLVVLPSLYEGFGLPVLEAMACGTPVLASNTSSLPEVGGDAAVYFESNSVESLRAELVRLLADPKTRASMSRKGLERTKEFSWTQAAQSTLNVLKRTG